MVKRKAPKDILQAWREGLTLDEAHSQFATQIDHTELLEEGRSRRRLSANGKQMLRQAGTDSAQFIGAIDGLNKVIFRVSAASQAYESRQRQLLEALEAGDMIALGYPVDRPKAVKPEPVPPFLFQDRYMKIGKSEFSDGENRYTKVRIVPASALTTPSIGRPSMKDVVVGIASALAKAGVIDRTMLPKVQEGEIRDYGKREFPDIFSDDRPSEQTIKRHLKAFWYVN